MIKILGLGVIIALIAGVVFLKPFSKRSDSPISNALQKVQENIPQAPKRSNDEPPLLLKSIGVNLDDIVFSKAYLTGFDQPFMGFGYVIPAKYSSTGQSKGNAQPTFILPKDTKVLSIVDGVVAAIPQLYSGDYSIQVTANGKIEKWIYETEHIINPKVKVGDKVVAGQVIAEVSNYNKNLPGFGIVEIGILKGGNPPQHICPFSYLDPSIKEETFKKIKALYKSWEEYIRNTALYSEDEPVTGCVSMDPIDG